MNKNREKALEGLTRIAQVIVSDKYHDESNEVLMFAKAIERIVASKGAYLPKTHKDTVLSMSISDEDTDAGSDFIELQPISEYEENKENIELGIDLTPNVDDGYVPIQTEEEEEEVLMPPEDDENSNEAPGYPPLHPDDDEDGIDIGFHRIPLNNTKKEDTNTNENIEDFQAHEEESEEKKDNETESEETESEVENVESELSIDDRILNFANSLDKNDETLWNKTDGSPKIKLFKEHFGDEFNIKSVELKELLGNLHR
jgi:hypothetical protein